MNARLSDPRKVPCFGNRPQPPVVAKRSPRLVAATALISLIALPMAAQLTNFTRMHSFEDSGHSGDSPGATVIEGSDGALYGVTLDVAGNRLGTVFKVSKAGTDYITLHRFGATPEDGTGPAARLVEGSDGLLYGTTVDGGGDGWGTVFRLRKDGGSYETIHRFGSSLPGRLGFAGGLIEGTDGNLYGTTARGPGTGAGVVYMMQKDGGGFVVLHEFSDAVSGSERYPNGVMEGSDGKLYGTTFGGRTNAGVLFTLNRDGSAYAVLHQFGIAPGDGASPVAGVIEGSDGALYGTTFQGGSLSLGVVYKVQRNGSGYSVLRDFTSELSEGSGLKSGLLESFDGWLYGVGEVGGSRSGGGTVFRMRKDGTGFAVLQVFGLGAGDGAQPAELTMGRDAVLYGVTRRGGISGVGTVFKCGPNGADYGVLVNFQRAGGDGQFPMTLAEGADGVFRGICRAGGAYGAGTLFKMDPYGEGYAVLRYFGSSARDGREPLQLIDDGATLHGLTRSGGVWGGGTLFRLNRDGSGFAVLRDFGDSPHAAAQPSALIRGSDGRLYGASEAGGAGGGTLFRLEADGASFSLLREFGSGSSDPAGPNCLVQGDDSRLYGITTRGGDRNRGVVFAVSTSGAGFVVLHHFTESEVDGRGALGLLEGSDGLFYGVTARGGTNSAGTIFRLDRNGTKFVVVRHFSVTNGEGGVLSGPLLEGPNGALYGLATSPEWFLFRLDKDGSRFEVLRRFAGGEGQGHGATLLRGRDGAFYGNTVSGGDLGVGMIFRFGHGLSLEFGAGRVLLGLTGVPGWNYQLQRSDDLKHWIDLLPAVPSDGTPVSHEDPIRPGGAAYYRVISP